ncbi:MAG: NAD-dependent epimerase/dehydratase family protein [bacterium]
MTLITGADGFIGRNLVEHLKLSGIKIKCLLEKSSLFESPDTEIVYGDLSDTVSLEKAAANTEIAVHLAGARTAANIEDYYRINFRGTENLLRACVKAGVKRIIFVSSLNVSLERLNAYADSKRMAEEAVRDSGLQWVILRPSLVYGRNDRNIIGGLISVIRKSPLLPVIGSGENRVQPLYIRDFVEVIRLLIDDFERYKGGVIDALGPNSVSYNQLADIICAVLGRKTARIKIPVFMLKAAVYPMAFFSAKFRVLKDKLYTYSIDKTGDPCVIENKFGFKPVSVRDGIAGILEA